MVSAKKYRDRVLSAIKRPKYVLLNALVGLFQGPIRWMDNEEGFHDHDRFRDLFADRGLESREAVHCDDLDTILPSLVAAGESGLEGGCGTPFDHDQQPCSSRLGAEWGEVEDGDHIFVPTMGMTPHMPATENSDSGAIELARARPSRQRRPTRPDPI